MAPPGVIPHWRSRRALQLVSHVFVSCSEVRRRDMSALAGTPHMSSWTASAYELQYFVQMELNDEVAELLSTRRT